MHNLLFVQHSTHPIDLRRMHEGFLGVSQSIATFNTASALHEDMDKSKEYPYCACNIKYIDLTGCENAELYTFLPGLPLQMFNVVFEMPERHIIFRLRTLLWLEGEIDELRVRIIPEVRIDVGPVSLREDGTKCDPITNLLDVNPHRIYGAISYAAVSFTFL